MSAEVRTAFGVDLIINWVSGQQVGFTLGEEPPRDAQQDRVSASYAEILSELPRLDEAGDGVRSFVGAILAAYCGAHPVIMIDEPEAFLHPPQSKRLGSALARTAATYNRQVIIATHSAEVLQGVLNSSDRVSVCRITRDGDVNNATVLESARLRELWAKPLLRSSAAIDGLFHRGAVVCEGDSDVRFYEAVLRRLDREGASEGRPDVYFVQGGGKGELATRAGAYKSLDTATVVIADLDLLRNQVELGMVLSALSGDFSTYEREYKIVTNALQASPPLTGPQSLVSLARQILDEVEAAGRLDNERRRQLATLLEEAASWSEATRYGMSRLRGEPHKLARELLEE